jgi:APA family basic amino acid/polyamine antiporter
MLPEAGGQYAFLRESYGRFPAFLYGWCLFLVINTGTIAALSTAFADSLLKVVALPSVTLWHVRIGGGVFEATTRELVAIAMILLVATLNHVGVGVGAAINNLATFAKIAVLLAIAIGGFFVASHGGAGGAANAVGGNAAGAGALNAANANPATTAFVPPDLLHGLVAAGIAIFWAYEGWYQLPFSAAEMKRPEKTLPRALVLGLAILAVLYVSVNAAYLALIPQSEMVGLAERVDVPRTAMARIFGSGAAQLVPLMICLSVFGAANPNLLSTPRAFYAMAKDGLVLRPLMAVHPRFRTPWVAIWTQAIWAILLVFLLQQFDHLTDYVVFVSLIFYGLTAAGVIVLRRKRPDLARPFRCPLVPIVPIVFVAVVLAVDVLTLTSPENRHDALIGLGILGAGVVAYFFVRRETPRADRGS